MSHISPVNPPALYSAAPYDYAARVGPGALLFTAGACPLDPTGRVTQIGDLEGQARTALANLDAVLVEAGASHADLVRTTVYVVGTPADLVTVWDVVAAHLAPHRPPSTLLGVAALGYANQLVEIDAVAALGDER
jgi:enamine deaminase RidA (YjgF/YER057c/UK114 family)